MEPEKLAGYQTLVKKTDHKILLGNAEGALYELNILGKDRYEVHFSDRIELPNNEPFSIRKMFQGRSGFLWIAGEKDQGLVMYGKHFYSRIDKNNGFKGENVLSMFQDKSGKLYIGTYGTGLYRTGQQQFYNYNNTKELNTPYIFSILTTGEGLYAGILNSGIYYFEGDNYLKYALKRKYDNKTGATTLSRLPQNKCLPVLKTDFLLWEKTSYCQPRLTIRFPKQPSSEIFLKLTAKTILQEPATG